MAPSITVPRSELLRRGILHSRARWLGAALLVPALLLLGATTVAALLGAARWLDLVLAFLAAVLSLAAFGSHSDTALALLRDARGARPGQDLPPPLEKELDEEFLFHRLELSELEATPRTAWLLTLAAPLALAAAVWGLLP